MFNVQTLLCCGTGYIFFNHFQLFNHRIVWKIDQVYILTLLSPFSTPIVRYPDCCFVPRSPSPSNCTICRVAPKRPAFWSRLTGLRSCWTVFCAASGCTRPSWWPCASPPDILLFLCNRPAHTKTRAQSLTRISIYYTLFRVQSYHNIAFSCGCVKIKNPTGQLQFTRCLFVC